MAENYARSQSSIDMAMKGRSHVLEQAQHLIVRGIVRDEEAQVGISQHSRNSDQPGSSTWDNTHVLPRVLTALALPMMHIVEIRNCCSQ
jgi:hypothetical protein